MLISNSKNRILKIKEILEELANNPNYKLNPKRVDELIGHAINRSCSFQEVYTDGSVSSSLVEGMNSLLKFARPEKKIKNISLKREKKKKKIIVNNKNVISLRDYQINDCIIRIRLNEIKK